MKSLRDLLQTLLRWLAAALALGGRRERTLRPAHGPAHPWHLAHARLHLAPRVRPDPTAPPPRPPRVAPPAHILALLASAPEVEPEFARPAPRRVALTLRAAATRLRIYNPTRPAAPDARPPRAASASLGSRLSRAVSPLRDWLLFDPGPPQPG
ncbi:MAG TPA: hypothetical protein VFH78_12705 [Candidatus Thermoplasmatota archaeon]|nr:hypothetical protein [Candidatus Thermoplasmatota archaeon]